MFFVNAQAHNIAVRSTEKKDKEHYNTAKANQSVSYEQCFQNAVGYPVQRSVEPSFPVRSGFST